MRIQDRNPQEYNTFVESYPLVPLKVSSRDLQLVGIAITFAKRQANRNPNDTQNVRILTAIQTRIPTAQFRGTLDISNREAEPLQGALNTYCESFRSRTKYQSLFQELHDLAVRLAETMEGHKTRNHGSPQLYIKTKTSAEY